MYYGACQACGRDLEPGQQRFCSDMCRDTYWEVFGVSTERDSFEDEDDVDLRDADEDSPAPTRLAEPRLYDPARYQAPRNATRRTTDSTDQKDEAFADDPDDDLDDDFDDDLEDDLEDDLDDDDPDDDDLIDLDDEYDNTEASTDSAPSFREQLGYFDAVLARDPKDTQSVDERSTALGQACLPVFDLLGSGRPIRLTAEVFWQPLDFSVRVLDFSPTTVAAIDPDADVELEGSLWLLEVEVTNLGKQPVEPDYLRRLMALVDEDDCVFTHFKSELDSDRASGLVRLAGNSAAPPLLPKITVRGTVPFVLPFTPAAYRLTTRKAAGL